MKQLKYLLLLLVAIISQGAWAEGEPELTSGVIGVTCPTHEGSIFEGDKLQSPASYKLYHFVPSVSGTLVIKNITGEPKMAVVGIFSSDYSFSTWAPLGDPFTYYLEKGSDYYIGFAPMYEGDSLDNEQFLVGLYCEKCSSYEGLTYIEGKESTCTTKGLVDHYVCDECGSILDDNFNFSDLTLLELPYAPHHFHAGECQNCDYVAQTITLTQNGGDYTFDGNVNYDLKSSVGENSNVSVFHVHTPAHGIVNVSAHVSKNEGRFDAYPPYLYFYQEGHVESQGYSTNMGYEPTLQCEDNLIANADYYLVVKNAEATNARLEVTLHPHETTCIQERVNPSCTESGVKALYGCSTCDYYFTDEGDVVYSTDAQYRTIPSLGHDFNENGVCTRCGKDLHISEGTHSIVIPACQATGETIGDYSYLAYFNAPRTGRLNIDLNGNSSRRKAIAVFKKNSDGEWQLLESRYNGYVYALKYDVAEGDAFIIGIRPYLNLSEIQNVSLKVKVLCTEHKWEYFEYKEPTCYESGHDAYRHCTICDTDYEYNVDVEIVPSFYDRSDHKFVNGVCQDCHYEVPTIELVKNEETGLYEYTNDNFDFDLKSSRWGDACSIFRVFVPEHGDINVKAYAYFDNDGDALNIIKARDFEYKEPNYGGGANASKKRNAAPINHNVSLETSVPSGDYIYILVNNNEVVESKLEVTLTPHEVECVQPHVDASCEDGMKAVYHCLSGCNDGYYYFTEDGIENPNNSDIFIPGTGHNENTDGVCTVCGQKVRLADGENHVQFASGNNNLTAFKFTATQTKCLNVAVETNATINDYIIMPWSEWMPSDNDDKPMSAPRKVSGQEEVEPLMTKNVIAGQEYAILFITTADGETSATITLSYTEIEYPVVTIGENTINIAANDVGLYGDAVTKPDTYELYKFVATKTGTLNVTSNLDADVLSAIFDADFNLLNIQAPSYGYSVDVERNKTYYIGLRTIGGYEYYGYKLNLEIEGIPEFNGTLVLDDTKSLEDNLGELIDLEMFTATEGVTYQRATTNNKWGTVVLPYELQSNNVVTYYQLSAVGDDNMTFSPVESVPANTPTVYRFNEAADNYQYDASTIEETLISIPEYPQVNGMAGVDDWMMFGFYETEVVSSETYPDEYTGMLASIRCISNDKFMTATNSLTIKPYRSVFMYMGQEPSMSRTFTIAIDNGGVPTEIDVVMTEDGIEEVEAIYDLNGRKLDTMKHGINIIRTADGKTRKFIKK